MSLQMRCTHPTSLGMTHGAVIRLQGSHGPLAALGLKQIENCFPGGIKVPKSQKACVQF